MQVQELPTKIVSSAFELVRRPVNVVGDLLGPLAPADVDCWSPRLGIDALEGTVKETVGSLLHDGRMRASGRATRETVARRRAARAADAAAAGLETQAEAELNARLGTVEAQRAAAEQRTASRKRKIAQEGATRTRAVRTRAEQREQAVGRVSEEAEVASERDGRARRLHALDVEAGALAAEQAATAAEHLADEAEEAIEQSRAERKRT